MMQSHSQWLTSMDMGQPDLVDIVAVPTRNVFRGWASAQLDVRTSNPVYHCLIQVH